MRVLSGFLVFVSALNLIATPVARASQYSTSEVVAVAQKKDLGAILERMAKQKRLSFLNSDKRESSVRELIDAKAQRFYVVSETGRSGDRMAIEFSTKVRDRNRAIETSLRIYDYNRNRALEPTQMIDGRTIVIQGGDDIAVGQVQLDQAIKGLEDSYRAYTRELGLAQSGLASRLFAGVMEFLVPSAQANVLAILRFTVGMALMIGGAVVIAWGVSMVRTGEPKIAQPLGTVALMIGVPVFGGGFFTAFPGGNMKKAFK